MSVMLQHGLGGLLACALLAGCGAPAPGQRARLGGPRPSADFVEGKRLFDEMRYREAEVCLRRAHEAEPQDKEIRDYLMMIELLTSGCHPNAPLSDMQQVSIKAAREELATLFAEGEALLEAGDVERASTRFERALEAIRWFPYKIDDEGLKGRAEEHLAAARAGQRGRPPAARPAAAPATARELPTSRDFVAGLRHYEAFDYRQAVDCFTRARETDPDDEVIHRYLLQAQLLVGDRVAEFETLEERLPPGR